MLGHDFQLPLDRAGFSRRECPRCDVHFKVRWSRRDARALAAVLAKRLEHLNGSEAAPEGFLRHCPYCATTAVPEAWWTLDQRQWFEAEASNLDHELRWRRLRMPLESLGENPRPTYVTVPPRRSAPPLPLDDDGELVTVPLPCCGEEMKVSDGWIGPVHCHYCGFVHARSITRDIGLELAQLRQWTSMP